MTETSPHAGDTPPPPDYVPPPPPLTQKQGIAQFADLYRRLLDTPPLSDAPNDIVRALIEAGYARVTPRVERHGKEYRTFKRAALTQKGAVRARETALKETAK